MKAINQRIAEEIAANPIQVENAVMLLDEGATVPFIARYRKEKTGGLDDTQLRYLAERLVYLREMEERRAAIVNLIDEQGKLTPELTKALLEAQTKTELEDLYLPYKKKRRTKAQIAREAGIEPLAQALLADPTQDPERAAAAFLNSEAGFADTASVLEGARHILTETFSEDAGLLKELRTSMWQDGLMVSRLVKGKEHEGAKFSDYFDFQGAIRDMPSHRVLALFRARNEGILTLACEVPNQDQLDSHPCQSKVALHFGIENRGRAADAWLMDSVRWAWNVKLSSHIDVELKTQLKENAEAEAIDVFANNLRDLLLAAPAGAQTTMGLDPGLRTGVKIAVVDDTSKLLDTATIYPHAPKNQWDQSIALLAVLAAKHRVRILSIGNGTASRETDRLAAELIKRYPELKLQKIVVSEAGASVYSASALAAKEFPALDVSLRGAVSIARRLQDPLAELVKIDPKSIGVGQYQHDVSQTRLAQKLSAVVEDCVNAVGVDVNMASVPLLAQVAGLSSVLAENIVKYRDEKGAFTNRAQLLQVARMGPKAYEQAAGFLRISNGDNPLDNSSVHPEAYPVVMRIIADTQTDIRKLIGDEKALRKLDPAKFTDDNFGVPTVSDILKELEKPGRDPRPQFKMADFREGVEAIDDLKPGMRLEGVVTNVTNFGAFVDIGVHQDGLVHISMLADKFVKDPREVVKAGDIVSVKVVEVDKERNRIALTMRTQEAVAVEATPVRQQNRQNPNNKEHKDRSRSAGKPTKKVEGKPPRVEPQKAPANTALADALRRSMKKS